MSSSEENKGVELSGLCTPLRSIKEQAHTCIHAQKRITAISFVCRLDLCSYPFEHGAMLLNRVGDVALALGIISLG